MPNGRVPAVMDLIACWRHYFEFHQKKDAHLQGLLTILYEL